MLQVPSLGQGPGAKVIPLKTNKPITPTPVSPLENLSGTSVSFLLNTNQVLANSSRLNYVAHKQRSTRTWLLCSPPPVPSTLARNVKAGTSADPCPFLPPPQHPQLPNSTITQTPLQAKPTYSEKPTNT